MDEITINVPDVASAINIIHELMKPLVDNKSLIMTHDYFSLNYDNLLDRVNYEELVLLGNQLGYSDAVIKTISKKIPKDQILEGVPEKINKKSKNTSSNY